MNYVKEMSWKKSMLGVKHEDGDGRCDLWTHHRVFRAPKRQSVGDKEAWVVPALNQ